MKDSKDNPCNAMNSGCCADRADIKTAAPCKPVTAVIVGAGHRALIYASLAHTRPDLLKIVAVADPLEYRRKQVAQEYGIPAELCFTTAEELAARPKMADAVINGTMDREHIPTSLPLLAAGYHMLLEKPIGISAQEVLELLQTARKYERTVMICHVLRYAPFYAAIRKLVLDGEIGEIMNIQTVEHVSYSLTSSAFVRGKWNNQERCGSSMLMAKCCHDLDLITWMMSGTRPVQVASFGSRMHFRREKAPANSGTRCLVDCPIEKDCMYSARKLYLDHPEWTAYYVWKDIEHLNDDSIELKTKSLMTDNPQGLCIWKCDNDVVDHQSVIVRFQNGATATHNLVAGAAKQDRSMHLLGTKGEIQGVLEEGRIIIRHADPRPGCEYSEKVIESNEGVGDMHGGGDMRLTDDFVRVMSGQTPSISTTFIEDSIYGHLMGFAADESRIKGSIVDIEEL